MPIGNNIDDIISVLKTEIDYDSYRAMEFMLIILWIEEGEDTQSKLFRRMEREWGMSKANIIWGLD